MSDDLFDMPEADGELPKDQFGRYRLPDPFTGKVAGRTRVTTFAKSISDTYALSAWQMRMAMKGMTMRQDLYALVAATPIDDRDKLNALAEDAKDAAAARAAANLGTAFHAFAEDVDKTGKMNPAMPPDLQRILAARQAALTEHQIVMVPEMIERTVWVPRYEIVGTFDRWGFVGVPEGDPGRIGPDDRGEILDDKTGRDLTYGQTEIAVQLACYANATHVLNREIFWEDWRRLTAGLRAGTAPKVMPTRCWEPMPSTRRDRAIVIHAPVKAAMDAPTEPPVVTIYEVDIKTGWEGAALCAAVRSWRKQRHLMTPLSVTVDLRKETTSPLGLADAVTMPNGPIRESLLRAADDIDIALLGPAAPGILDTSTGEPAEILEADMPNPVRDLANAEAVLAAPNVPDDVANAAFHQAMDAIQAMETRPPTWEERLRAASSQGDLSAIWREAAGKGEWTDELEKIGLSQLSKLRTG
jgi:hypothetical protein